MFEKLFLVVCTYILLSSSIAKGQGSMDTQYSSDSIIQVLRQADSIRIMDSMQRNLLFIQLEQIKSSESFQKMQLLQKIQQLEMADSLRMSLRLEQLNRYKDSALGSVLMPFGDTICVYYLNIGPFSPAERAMAAHERILKIYEDRNFIPDSLYTRLQGNSADIFYKNRLIISITNDDALWYARNTSDLALDIRNQIATSIQRELKAHSLSFLLERIGLSLLILLAIAIIIFFVFKYFEKFKLFVVRKEQPLLVYLQQKPLPIFTPERLLYATDAVMKGLRILVVVIILSLLSDKNIIPIN
jgi:hypothetical protein